MHGETVKQTIYFVIFLHKTHKHKWSNSPALYTRHFNLGYYTALREERRLRVFENWVSRKIFGPKMDEVERGVEKTT